MYRKSGTGAYMPRRSANEVRSSSGGCSSLSYSSFSAASWKAECRCRGFFGLSAWEEEEAERGCGCISCWSFEDSVGLDGEVDQVLKLGAMAGKEKTACDWHPAVNLA